MNLDSIHDDDEPIPQSADSAVRKSNSSPEVLKVYKTGPLTVVGFDGNDVPDEVCIAAYRDQLLALIDKNQCTHLAFDLTGVRLIPSGMLGLLTSLRKRVPTIELYNPSQDIRDVLRMTNLISLFELKELKD